MKYKIQIPGVFPMWAYDLPGLFDTRKEAEEELREIKECIPDFEGFVSPERTPGEPLEVADD